MYTANDFNTENAPKEMVQYIIDQIEYFDAKYAFALKQLEELRCPIWMANQPLAMEMQDNLDDWCNDNEDNSDLYDINEIFG